MSDLHTRISPHCIEKVLKTALSQGWLREEDTAAIFYDLTFLKYRISQLVSAFPDTTLHGLAIKANPLLRIMKKVHSMAPNIGVETASIGEVNLALKTGHPAHHIVYDSPVKTHFELKYAIAAGVHINIDNLTELARIAHLVADQTTQSTFGIRINPQVGVGMILESSVAGEYSKFGVPMKSRRSELESAFYTYPWLTGVHLHVGSQGCSLQLLTDGIGVLYDFVIEVNKKREMKGFPPVSVFDIGGGLPVSYRHDQQAPSMEEYVSAIRNRAPNLLTKFRLITEFGRWVYTNAGWTVSRVEYVKHDPGINTAMIHVGADLFVRECLNPRDWRHEYSAFNPDGKLKTGIDAIPYNLAGPLCFSGDILAKKVNLPLVKEGDYLVIHDSGSYTFSMWSRYNSRQTPRIIGYLNDGKQFEILKERETLEELYNFWR
ncbi:MAG: hypothetical protein M0P47_00430 [Bacteroidales bacterium]|nr:hypothetical protein [Bacteroidales bacterium]